MAKHLRIEPSSRSDGTLSQLLDRHLAIVSLIYAVPATVIAMMALGDRQAHVLNATVGSIFTCVQVAWLIVGLVIWARTSLGLQSRIRSAARVATSTLFRSRIAALIGFVTIGMLAGFVVYNLVLPQLSSDYFPDSSRLIGGRRAKFHPYASNPMLWLIAGLSFAVVFAYLAYCVSTALTVLGRWRKPAR